VPNGSRRDLRGGFSRASVYADVGKSFLFLSKEKMDAPFSCAD